MRRNVFWLIALLLLAPPGRAADEQKEKSKSEKDSAAAKQFRELQDDLKKLREEAVKANEDAKTDEEKQKVQDGFREKLRQQFVGRALDLAAKYPKEDEAFKSLQFVLAVGRPDQVDKAVDLLLKEFAKSDSVITLAQQLAQQGSSAAEKLLQGLLQQKTGHDQQAGLYLGLGQLYKSQSESADMSFPEAVKLNEKAEKAFAQVTDEFKDVKDVAEQAKASLFEVRTLGIGKKAPDISGEDADSKKFKLSDYRGKVVVLDFWASW
jgi:hypothetical protein